MKTLLGKLKSALTGIVKVFSSGAGEKVFDTVIALVPQAMPIVRVIAMISPTRADDEILRLLDQYNLLGWADAYLKLPIADRGPALQHAAATVLANIAPAGTSRSELNAAISLAVVALKAETK